MMDNNEKAMFKVLLCRLSSYYIKGRGGHQTPSLCISDNSANSSDFRELVNIVQLFLFDIFPQYSEVKYYYLLIFLCYK